MVLPLKQYEKGAAACPGCCRTSSQRYFSAVIAHMTQKKLKGQGRMMLISTNTATRCGYLTVLLILAMASAFTHAVAQDFPPDVTRGKTVYERHCLACHGSGGRGDGPDAAALRVPPMNFHRFTSVLKSDEELLRTIEHGVVFSSMHSWQGILTETEQQDALAYIRFLVQQGQ